MKILKLIILCFVVLLLSRSVTMVGADTSILPKANDIHLAPNAIGMPVGKILLIRKLNEYCAVKFIHNLTGKTKYEQHAEYDSYYQGDKTGNFNNKNVKYLKEEVYYKRPIFSIFGHGVSIGAKLNINCGPVVLWWSAGPNLIFVYYNSANQKQGDYGIELAPTPWTDIKEVNVFDPRIKWYRYDENRKRVNIPIDKLWGGADRGQRDILRN